MEAVTLDPIASNAAFTMSARVQDQGFSLPIVLVLIGALSAATLVGAETARHAARRAAGLTGLAQAEALSDVGVALALIAIEGIRADRRGALPQMSRAVHSCSILPSQTASLTYSFEDEGGKIDINYASASLLAAFVSGLGLERAQSHTLAASILAYRDPSIDAASRGVEDAGRPAGTPTTFKAVHEITNVAGVTPQLFTLMQPYITVHSGRDGVDPDVAAPVLIDMLARGDADLGHTASMGAADVSSVKQGKLPAHFAQPSLHRYYTLRVEVVLNTTVFVRDAVVEINPAAATVRNTPRHRFWKWRRGEKAILDKPAPVAALPAC